MELESSIGTKGKKINPSIDFQAERSFRLGSPYFHCACPVGNHNTNKI